MRSNQLKKRIEFAIAAILMLIAAFGGGYLGLRLAVENKFPFLWGLVAGLIVAFVLWLIVVEGLQRVLGTGKRQKSH